MKIKYLRLLDKYLGFLLCLILFMFKPPRRRPPVSEGGKFNKILVIKFWGFGSIILAYDFFQVIRRKFPDAYICALTLKQNRQIFEMSGLFDEVISIDIRSPLRLFAELAKPVFSLSRRSFDVSFDLEFTARFSAIVSCLINAKKRIGFRYGGIWRGDCFTDTVRFKENEKLKKSFLDLAGLVGAGTDAPAAALKLNTGGKQEEAQVNDLLKKKALLNSGNLVLLNINVSELCLLRRWPKEYFVALAEGLIEKNSAQIIFIGSEDDLSYVDSTIALVSSEKKASVHNFAGKFSLAQLAYLIGKSRLFISNDSGPLHLAAYLGIPTISFFGPETPVIYGPEGEFDTIFYRDFSCSPCIRIKKYKSANCGHNQRCLREIKPEEVLDEIRRKGIF